MLPQAIYAQVDERNNNAHDLFCKYGYPTLFSDPTCKNIVLHNDYVLFAKEVTVTKCTMRKKLFL